MSYRSITPSETLLNRVSAQYVVSGSDGGHLFIWDKKTSELVNILEGDNEVVNVVQGKPLDHDHSTQYADTIIFRPSLRTNSRCLGH